MEEFARARGEEEEEAQDEEDEEEEEGKKKDDPADKPSTTSAVHGSYGFRFVVFLVVMGMTGGEVLWISPV